MDLDSTTRNGTLVFAERVLINAQFLSAAAAEGAPVHRVTQTVLSALGVIVFPWQHDAIRAVLSKSLSELEADGWPAWTMRGTRKVVILKDLVHMLRNCVAHGRVEFDSDSREPTDVIVRFDHRAHDAKPIDWTGSIRADALESFLRRYLLAIKDWVA